VTVPRRLVPVVLFAASVAAFVVSGLSAGERPSPTPSKARATDPYIDTRTGCEHLVEGCTIGKRVNTGQVQITLRPATTP
jgi:hypothetical protein